MNRWIIASLGAALALTSFGCTSILGDITFDRAAGGGGGGTTSGSTSGTGGDTGGTGGTTSGSTTSGPPTCQDITCTSPATCEEVGSGAKCVCPSGYEDVKGDGSDCQDWDECAGENGGHDCDATLEVCVNDDGGFSCACGPKAIEFPAGSGVCIQDPCNPNLCPTQHVCTSDTGVAVCNCVVFVDPAATGSGNGTSWANAFKAIQPAIDAAGVAAASAQTTCDVWVKEGTYYLYSATSTTVGIGLRTDVGVYGGFAGTEKLRGEADPKAHPTILSGKKSANGSEHTNHVVGGFDIQNAVVDGFTIQDGAATSGPSPEDQRGGGVLIYVFNADDASLTVSRCDVTGNTALAGGGVSMIPHNGKPLYITVLDSDIHGNSAVYGGGGVNCAGVTCTIKNTTIRSNVAQSGGGLFSDAALIADTVTFADNVTTGGDGGGVMLSLSASGSSFQNVVFSGNRADQGGAGGGLKIGALSSPVVITNAAFVGNSADAGGAIHDVNGSGLSCRSCTITGNRGTNGGDGIFWTGGAPTLTNTIVWGNPVTSQSTGKGVDPPTWASVNATYSDIQGYSGTSMTVINQNPMFVKLPVFFDRVASFTLSTTMVAVPSGLIYTANDVIEIGGDGVARTVSAVDGNTNVITFAPALGAPAPSGTAIRNWGGALASVDLHLKSGSPCIDIAMGAPATDIEGKMRLGGGADLGAYESH